MKISRFLPALVLFFTFSHLAIADQVKVNSNLQEERQKVIKQYIINLQNADYKKMTQIFEKNGYVISTSRGRVNAKEFFYSFLSEVVSAETDIHQIFNNDLDCNRLAARFHFKFKLKDGELGEGEYVDEFIFGNQSSKLTAVYMFENLKFE